MRARLITAVAASLLTLTVSSCGLSGSPSPEATCEQTLVSGGWLYKIADYDGPDPEVGAPIEGGAYYPPCNDGKNIPDSGTDTEAWAVVGQPDLVAVKNACALAAPEEQKSAGCDPNAPKYATWKKYKQI